MSDQDPFPPPSPDPGGSPEEILGEIKADQARLGCLGVTLHGGWALLGMAALIALLIWLLSRCFA